MNNPSEAILPAGNAPPVSLKIGSQDLKVHPGAEKFLITRSGQTWEASEIAALGESDIFVRRDGTGQVKLTYKQVKLSVEKKELVAINKNFMPTVIGFNKLNQYAGINQITPPSLLVNGAERSNPHPEFSPDGEIVRMVARKIAIGFSPTGNLVAMDVVKIFNFDAYYLQDLMKKATEGCVFCKFGSMVICEIDPSAKVSRMRGKVYARTENKVYVFKLIKDIEGLWIDVTHKEIKALYDNHTQRQKFAGEQAQSMAWRNALKAHPAFALSSMMVSGVGEKAVAHIGVYSYKNPLSQEEYQEIGAKIARGEQAQVLGQAVETHREVSDQDAEEFSQAVVDDADFSDEARSNGGSAAAVSEPDPDAMPSVSREDITPRIIAAAKAKGLDAEKMAKEVYGTRLSNMTNAQLVLLEKTITNTTSGKQADSSAKKG